MTWYLGYLAYLSVFSSLVTSSFVSNRSVFCWFNVIYHCVWSKNPSNSLTIALSRQSPSADLEPNPIHQRRCCFTSSHLFSTVYQSHTLIQDCLSIIVRLLSCFAMLVQHLLTSCYVNLNMSSLTCSSRRQTHYGKRLSRLSSTTWSRRCVSSQCRGVRVILGVGAWLFRFSCRSLCV